MATRIGIDVGGTFTDLILLDEESGEVTVGKGPSNPAAVDQRGAGVARGHRGPVRGGARRRTSCMARRSASTRCSSARAPAWACSRPRGFVTCSRFGACCGSTSTASTCGTTCSRRRNRSCPGRCGWAFASASSLTARSVEPLDSAGVSRGGRDVRARRRRVRRDHVPELAREPGARAGGGGVRCGRPGFAGPVSLSHLVSGQYREYERASTTVVDAYVRPAVSGYLERLESGLREEAFAGECLITTSAGGCLSFAEARSRPFETAMSGPVAGAVGASKLCAELGLAARDHRRRRRHEL